MKLKMIDAHKAGEGYKKIAKDFQVPVSSVQNVIKKYQLTGTVKAKISSGRPRKISNIYIELLVGLLEKQVRSPILLQENSRGH